nr:MAK10-like protein [Tanacetum cinerariifolium]
MGDENPICTLGDYSKPSHEGYRDTIELPVGNNMVPLRSDTIRLVQNGCSFHGLRKLRNKTADESWEIIKNLTLYDHEGCTDTKEFVKPVRAISTPQGPSPQPQALGTTRELTTSRTPEKVLIREEAIFLVTKNVNSISLARGEEEKSDKMDDTLSNTIKSAITAMEIPVKEAERNNETKNKPIKKVENKEVDEVLSSRHVEYYLKHMINEKLIEGLVNNNRFNNSLSMA